MTDTKDRRIAEIVGLIGIIGSLVFVGLEVRQSSIATRAATDAAVADGFRELNLAMASSPDLARALAAHTSNPEEAPREDQVLILGLYRALFHIWSNAHRQHLNGTIDPAVYQAVVQELSAYAVDVPAGANVEDIRRRQRLTKWAWESERFIYNLDFQRLVDSALASAPGDQEAGSAGTQPNERSELDQESVWRAVLARNTTWLENDFAGHLALYHPEFRRWSLNEPTLMTKAGFAALWNSIKANEEVISLDVDLEEVVFYANSSVAIAHYTTNESWRWIGDDRTNGDGSIVRNETSWRALCASATCGSKRKAIGSTLGGTALAWPWKGEVPALGSDVGHLPSEVMPGYVPIP
jgi:hypothetical protein